MIPILDLKPEIEALWPEISQALARVVRSGHFVLGEETARFEKEVAQYLGVPHAIGVNSGTDALVIALRALGIGPGDEVITTPFTFFGTAEAISLVGATPVFADICPHYFDLDPGKIAITERTKAIIPVHLFGQSANLEAILAIAQKAQVAVIEDVAQAFGAITQGRRLGSLGTLGCFSFFPTKNLGAFGDAGLIVTHDPELALTARKLRTHGSIERYQNEMLGYNSRLDEMQAAVLRIKLPRVDAMNRARNLAAHTYTELLADISGVECSAHREDHVYHQFTVRIKGGRRDSVAAYLKSQGISSIVYYPVPVHRLAVYKHLNVSCPVAEQAANEVLSLPIWPHISTEIQERVVSTIARALLEQDEVSHDATRVHGQPHPSL